MAKWGCRWTVVATSVAAMPVAEENMVARSKVASHPTGQTPPRDVARPSIGRSPGVKVVVFGVVVLSLVGFFAVALTRELNGNQATAQTAMNRPTVATPRPALSAAEETYAQALWPIHNEVKASALKMTLAGIQYKTQKLDAAGLKVAVEASDQVYRRAEGQVGDLQPPTSLRSVHDDYLKAVRLYQQSAAEMVKLYDDRRDEHLVDAFPMSQEGGRILRTVGGVLWPTEYVPN